MAKKKKKKKHQGHFCRICHEHKSNESFTGKGHAKHICKKCSALPQERKNELRYINQIDRIAVKYPRSRQDWELLEKYSKNKKYPEAMEFAQMILDQSRKYSLPEEEDEQGEYDCNIDELFPDKMVFSEFNEYAQGDIQAAIEEDISDFIFSVGDLPMDKDKQDILKFICRHIAFGYGQTLVLNKELNDLFDVILKEVVEELEKEDSED